MLKTINDVSTRRYISLNILIIIVFGTLVVKFFQLQVAQHNRYDTKARINSIRAKSLHAPRGSILDKYSKIIVDNSPTYVLYALPNEVGNIDSTISIISNLINVDLAIIAENYTKYYNGYFAPVRLIKDLSFDQISLLEEHKLDLPGIEYKQIQERNFPLEMNGSHFLGYVVEVDRANIKKLLNPDDYKYGDLIGLSGLEKYYENHLRENKGVEYNSVDAYGRIIGKVADKQSILPSPGNDLTINIDSDLQNYIEELMKGRRGCAIISEPESGAILSFVNSPSYPADFYTGATPIDEWNRILKNPEKPLLNRITRGTYPPGSILKMIVIAYILEKNVTSPNTQFYCSGKYQFGNRAFGCWDEDGHGYVNLNKALIQSCDVYFYNIIQEISLNDWALLCNQFGFGTKTGIDLPSESIGNIPNTEYFNKRYGNRGWTDGLKLNIAIGQGETLVTPVQLLKYINAIYTNGKLIEPHFATIYDASYSLVESISDNTFNRIKQLLFRVVNDKKGTGRMANPNIEGLEVSGKTGTAENPHGEPHAWFIGYAVKNNESCSFVVLLENAGHGGDEAAPIVSKILSFMYEDSVEGEE